MMFGWRSDARKRNSCANDNAAAKALYLAAGYRRINFDQYELPVE